MSVNYLPSSPRRAYHRVGGGRLFAGVTMTGKSKQV